MNCKDDELNAKLYSNRAAAHFNLGKTLLYIGCLLKYLISCILNRVASLNDALKTFWEFRSCYERTLLKLCWPY